MELIISTDHYPSLLFKDWDSAVEFARKLNYEYIDIRLIEFNAEEIGYGIYNCKKEELIEKEDLQLFHMSK
ncbi:hypothetical protein [Methanobrevibacter sp.]|uniref:hypothetical protein n=1 Tax=Methanobrevibacter sp. TaxID=66852 RepID=UPI00386BCCBD